MFDVFKNLHPVAQDLIATLFTWGVTALGAAIVVFTKNISRKFLDTMLGFAAGVMISASFWSLLAPSISLAREMGLPPWLPAIVGFLSGGIFLRLIDKVLPHLHPGFSMKSKEGVKTSWQKTTWLLLAITLHNIPGGLTRGMAFRASLSGF